MTAMPEITLAPSDPGLYFNIPNEAYHAGPGVSKSQLDDIAINPAVFQWRKSAPEDEEKKTALDMGTALHCILLEPQEFDLRFVIAPKFDRRTTEGKKRAAHFLEENGQSGKTVLEHEEHRKLLLMRDSTFAHPAARYFLEAEGHCEASIYWDDEQTGELCRIRPDRFLKNQPVIVDVKKVADMERFARHVDEFRYHVQDAMYRDGFYQHFNEYPQFVFIAVSESINCGRYPVRVFQLEQEDVAVGHDLYRRDLNTYHQCRLTNTWGGVESLSRPAWARKKDNQA